MKLALPHALKVTSEWLASIYGVPHSGVWAKPVPRTFRAGAGNLTKVKPPLQISGDANIPLNDDDRRHRV